MSRAYPRVVFDTNVLLQALLNPLGPSGLCFDLARQSQIQLFISESTLSEIEEVIARPGIRSLMHENPTDQIERFLSELKAVAYHAIGKTDIFRLDRDPKDEMIVELAVGCDADYIVSWDNDLLELMTGFDAASKEFRQRFRGIKVVDPNAFLNAIGEINLALQP